MNTEQKVGLRIRGVLQILEADGSLAHEEHFDSELHLDGNGYTTVGLNDVLNQYYAGSAFTAAWYVGLVDNAGFSSFSAADTMGSHAGWSENTTYSNSNRPTATFGSASGASQVSGNCDFSINGSCVIHGCFITNSNTKGGTTGLLSATLAFAANQTLANGQTLRIILTNTASG